jgi:hypothetical protein
VPPFRPAVALFAAVLTTGLPWTAGAAAVPPAGAVPPAVGSSPTVTDLDPSMPGPRCSTPRTPGKTLSLRAVATDATGGSIDRTVLNAIPVT